jgi:CsoR family transcriptional regulator, copper-sensing transcriptional repressor
LGEEHFMTTSELPQQENELMVGDRLSLPFPTIDPPPLDLAQKEPDAHFHSHPIDEHVDEHAHQHADEHAHQHADEHAHQHVHSEESLRQIVNRLSRIEGHVRGIKTMVQESRDCPDVLVQIAAVRGALDRVARMILDEHLNECVARAAKEGNIAEELEGLKAALDRFLP